MGNKELLASINRGVHADLGHLVGEWQGTSKTWFEPGKLADESPIQGAVRSILGGRFVLHEYRSSLRGESFEGAALIGFHLERNQFEVAWVDSFHTGSSMMFSQSQNARFSVMSHYGDGQGGPNWGWRTELVQPDPNMMTITCFNVTPEGQADKAIEIHYQRLISVK